MGCKIHWSPTVCCNWVLSLGSSIPWGSFALLLVLICTPVLVNQFVSCAYPNEFGIFLSSSQNCIRTGCFFSLCPCCTQSFLVPNLHCFVPNRTDQLCFRRAPCKFFLSNKVQNVKTTTFVSRVKQMRITIKSNLKLAPLIFLLILRYLLPRRVWPWEEWLQILCDLGWYFATHKTTTPNA